MAVAFVGCGGGDTTVIQTVATTTTPAPTTQAATTPTTPTTSGDISTVPVEPKVPPGSVDIAKNAIQADYYRAPLSYWPNFSEQTKIFLIDLFLNNNPNDCAALRQIEDAVIGVSGFVDRAASEPSLQEQPISEAMLRYCHENP